jgi:hypothetical protein
MRSCPTSGGARLPLGLAIMLAGLMADCAEPVVPSPPSAGVEFIPGYLTAK